MKPDIPKAMTIALVFSTQAIAGEATAGDPEPPMAASAPWSGTITAYPTVVRGGENYTSAIATANKGGLHLEARYNYESVGARSAFVGWNFSGGTEITWQVTPLIGGAWGATQAFVPGFEASVAWGAVDVYVEAELVRDNQTRTDSYTYAWSELGYRPFQWLRAGLAGQRSRAYSNDRNFQRGPFVQFNWGPAKIGAYWFNPGSNEQILVGMIGFEF